MALTSKVKFDPFFMCIIYTHIHLYTTPIGGKSCQSMPAEGAPPLSKHPRLATGYSNYYNIRKEVVKQNNFTWTAIHALSTKFQGIPTLMTHTHTHTDTHIHTHTHTHTHTHMHTRTHMHICTTHHSASIYTKHMNNIIHTMSCIYRPEC